MQLHAAARIPKLQSVVGFDDSMSSYGGNEAELIKFVSSFYIFNSSTLCHPNKTSDWILDSLQQHWQHYRVIASEIFAGYAASIFWYPNVILFRNWSLKPTGSWHLHFGNMTEYWDGNCENENLVSELTRKELKIFQGQVQSEIFFKQWCILPPLLPPYCPNR